MSSLAPWGFALAAVASAIFASYLLRVTPLSAWRDAASATFLAAILATAAWGVSAALDASSPWKISTAITVALDMLRYGLWLVFLLLQLPAGEPGGGRWRPGVLRLVVLLVWGSAAVCSIAAIYRPDLRTAAVTAGLGLGVVGLVLLEQLFRNQSEDGRWNAKPVCVALGFNFAFDVYLHTEAVMFGRFDPDALSLRGMVYAATLPLLFIASRRQSTWISRLKLSRSAAFYSASLLLIGGYLLFFAAVGYYVRYFGGDWGRVMQLALLILALLMLAVVVLSGAVRSRLRVFLSKNFFTYRYDYRGEWLRVTAMLSSKSAPQDVGVLVVRSLADLVECPSGSLWTLDLDGAAMVPAARWNVPEISEREPSDSPFCNFMREHQWIIDIDEFRSQPRRYGDLTMPLWLVTSPHAWLVIPLLVADELTGFVVLSQPRTRVEPNWEVRDLLKIAARQAAGFLAQMQATEALLEARKFDAFNRMSAFVVHDLKNIVTQLSLMVKNARRFGGNPEFQQDMLLTVESSLDKMRQMMLQLREGAKPVGATSGVELQPLLQRLVDGAARRGRACELQVMDPVATRGDEERLERVLGHLVQNALDATPPSGKVWVRLQQSSGRAMMVIGDTGRGMSQEFIQTRLFRPFNTTKEGGMGIGAYESFQYVKELGGTIDVHSEPGRGSEITVLLPLLDSRRVTDLQMTSEQ
ncbi:XrtA/PEP-CTERM system histidine kinase PrsK [Aquabacterium sp.]|uniref:XrtA/PEP-CTERM system histidine kinase PrsK n=1 Tax=Aquabacterium sp. TaxID=1872578 RepID=UPI003784C8E4